ncbi:unnamed protein product [Linum trigynum]|uniref:Uncharacterized protein n=1 Tax=Linum trigynum TaxID=586398 RepID=A0AAV2DMP6_9ROSI
MLITRGKQHMTVRATNHKARRATRGLDNNIKIASGCIPRAGLKRQASEDEQKGQAVRRRVLHGLERTAGKQTDMRLGIFKYHFIS